MIQVILGLICASSIGFNIYQVWNANKSKLKGLKALEVIADITNFVQEKINASSTIEDVKTAVKVEVIKDIAKKAFDEGGMAKSVHKDLKGLWDKGRAKIKDIF